MAISHVCLGCGFDLARTASTHGLVDGLPIVACPRCGTAAVRRRHPIARRYRQWRRLNGTLGCLTLQLLLVVVLAAMHLQVVRELQVIRWTGAHRDVLIWSLCAMIVVGAWLTAGLSHWRRPAAFATWGAFIALLLLCRPILRPLVALATGEHRPIDLSRWSGELVVLAMTLVVAGLGVPLGIGVGRYGQHWKHWRWRRRRARMRARRSA